MVITDQIKRMWFTLPLLVNVVKCETAVCRYRLKHLVHNQMCHSKDTFRGVNVKLILTSPINTHTAQRCVCGT